MRHDLAAFQGKLALTRQSGFPKLDKALVSCLTINCGRHYQFQFIE